MNYVKKLNLHWFCTQNHILEPFSVRRACTKSYVTSEPYPRASQIWCQNVQETWKKKVIKCRGESFARCRVIARNVEGGGLLGPPPPVFLGLRALEALEVFDALSHAEPYFWAISYKMEKNGGGGGGCAPVGPPRLNPPLMWNDCVPYLAWLWGIEGHTRLSTQLSVPLW